MNNLFHWLINYVKCGVKIFGSVIKMITYYYKSFKLKMGTSKMSCVYVVSHLIVFVCN